MELIDKAAVVAEIEKRRTEWQYDSSIEAKYKHEECDDILSSINTLEVKDVDLDKEARHYLLYEHESPLSRVLHEIDLLIEMQYHRDIENAFKAGCELGLKKHRKEINYESKKKRYKLPF